MADSKRRKRLALWLPVVGMCVAGPAVTVLIGLGGIASFAAYMDLHGFTATMRIAVVGAVAVALIPAAWGIGAWLCDRIDAKKHKAQLAALNYQRPRRHR